MIGPLYIYIYINIKGPETPAREARIQFISSSTSSSAALFQVGFSVIDISPGRVQCIGLQAYDTPSVNRYFVFLVTMVLNMVFVLAKPSHLPFPPSFLPLPSHCVQMRVSSTRPAVWPQAPAFVSAATAPALPADRYVPAKS